MILIKFIKLGGISGSWSQTSAPRDYWYAIACNSTGQFLIAVQGNAPTASMGIIMGYIFISTSRGVTWTQTTAPYGDWITCASDSTGIYLAAGQYGGYIYMSTSGQEVLCSLL